MEDLAGIGKVTEVILDKVAAVTGTLYEPTQVRRLGKATAEVEANAIITRTEAELKAELLRNDQKVKLSGNESRERELRFRAGNRVLEQETRRQANIEYIIGESLDYVRSNNGGEVKPREIDDDWMDAFIRYSQDISETGVRQLWSKILAEQAQEDHPIISKVTLDALRLLESRQAKVFKIAAQMFMCMGQILEMDPLGESDYSFNLNTMDVLALEDIGFVKRMHMEEYALDLRDGVITFWDDYAEAPGPVKEGENRLIMHREWNNEVSRDHVLDAIIGISLKNKRDNSGLRKSVKVDRLQLTARGFELAAIVYPEFNEIIGSHNISDFEQAGDYVSNDFREKLLLEWVDNFATTGVVVVRNESKDTSTVDASSTALKPVAVYDSVSKEWITISPSE